MLRVRMKKHSFYPGERSEKCHSCGFHQFTSKSQASFVVILTDQSSQSTIIVPVTSELWGQGWHMSRVWIAPKAQLDSKWQSVSCHLLTFISCLITNRINLLTYVLLFCILQLFLSLKSQSGTYSSFFFSLHSIRKGGRHHFCANHTSVWLSLFSFLFLNTP